MRIQSSIGILGLSVLSALVAPAQASAQRGAPSAVAAQRSEQDVVADLTGKSPARRQAAADYIIQNPASVNPLYLANAANILWARGDRLQAAFWFYVFQTRSRPWSDEDAYAPLRASLNAMLGPMINKWVASDIDAWQDVAMRAAAYEEKIPLYPERPKGVSQAEWSKRVQVWRDRNQQDLKAVFARMQADPVAFGETRRSNGLYVGPLQDPGAPLPGGWR